MTAVRCFRRLYALLQAASRDSAGSSLLEYALALIALLTVILGIINASMALYANHYVASAAREGARYAMVRGSSWGGTACTSPTSVGCTATPSSVQTYLLSVAPKGVQKANTTITTAWSGTNAAGSACYTANGSKGVGCSVTVSVSYAFNLSLPLLPKNAIKFSSSSTMPITQ